MDETQPTNKKWRNKMNKRIDKIKTEKVFGTNDICIFKEI